MKQIIQCPAERAVYFLGGKWKIRILFLIYQSKKLRFGEIKKVLQRVTQQMLSKQLKELQPDFWCKGGDYDEDSLNKSELKAKGNAILKVIPFTENISTSDIIKKIK